MEIKCDKFEGCFYHEASNHPKVKTKDFTENLSHIADGIDVVKSFVYSTVTLVDHTETDKPVYVDKDGERIYISRYLCPAGTKFGSILCAGNVYLGPKAFKLNDSDIISKPNMTTQFITNADKADVKVRMLTPKEWNAVLEMYSSVFGLNWNLQPIEVDNMYLSVLTSINVPDKGLVEWDDNHTYDKEFIYLLNYQVNSDVKSLFNGAKLVSTKDFILKDYLVPLKLIKSTEVKK